MSETAQLLEAIAFAAGRHRTQRRKGNIDTPYVNHCIEVARLLATVGGVTDIDVLRAAVLHDTVEDTETTPDELEQRFGARVRALIEEMTDDKSLPKEERKALQIEHAPALSADAKLIKFGDKIANVRDLTNEPPQGWDAVRKREYLDWTEAVIDGCGDANPALKQAYITALIAARRRDV